MGVYLDTSALVSMHFKESRTTALLDWLDSMRGADLAVSQWALAEFSSAAAFKLRARQITVDEEATGHALFAETLAGLLTVVDVLPSDFAGAADLCRQKIAPLRAGDALHLAICKRAGRAMLTLDNELAAACRSHGVAVERLGEQVK